MEEFLNELLTFIDKKTDWKVNNDTTNSQVITEFLYRNKELTSQFIESVGKPDSDTDGGLHKHGVMQPKGDPNCKLCGGKGYYSFSTFDGSTTTTVRCGCLQFGA